MHFFRTSNNTVGNATQPTMYLIGSKILFAVASVRSIVRSIVDVEIQTTSLRFRTSLPFETRKYDTQNEFDRLNE